MKKLIILVIALSVNTLIAKAQTAKTANAPQAAKADSAKSNAKAATSPLYEAGGFASQNPLSQSSAMVAGNPIGGIIVKGGVNAPAKVEGSPIGGIVVRTEKNAAVALVVPAANGKSISEKGIK